MSTLGAEASRLAQESYGLAAWKRWGPYVSLRQWGTVREDYSGDGDAWRAFPHDHARSRAYRWGEDGLGAICDRWQHLCFGLALWNGHDPFIKERLFGLTNPEGNHGEDVKEYWWPLDSTPTHSFMRWLYRYPQARFPYEELLAENARRGRLDPEYELVDTGVLDENRFFDVEIVYAKSAPDDLCIDIRCTNHGPARPACTSCQLSGSAIPGRGGATTGGHCSGRTTTSPSPSVTAPWVISGCRVTTPPPPPPFCIPKTRRTTSAFSAVPTPRLT